MVAGVAVIVISIEEVEEKKCLFYSVLLVFIQTIGVAAHEMRLESTLTFLCSPMNNVTLICF